MAEKGIVAVEHGGTQLAHVVEFSNEQVRLLAETVAKGCDQNELAFFLNVCKLKRLDPFTGQVHCVKRWDSNLGREKMSIQVGIDGFRVIAVRTNELAGISEPEFDDEDGQYPKWAKVTVYRYGRGDEKIAYTAKARYSEYVQTKKDGTPNHMWANKPYIMLGKCAEALALRKAFPDELSGMYSDDEMGQADNNTALESATKPPVQQPQRASEVKKQQEQQSQPAQGQNSQTQQTPENKIFSGIIEQVKQLKSVWWLTIKGEKLIIRVLEKDIDQDMVAGNFIKFRGTVFNNPQVGDFLALLALIELSPVQEAEVVKTEGKLSPDAEAAADAMFGKQEPQGHAVIEDLKSKGQVTTASNLPEPPATKPGTIGQKRAKRLYTIAGQNKKATGFTEENIHKVLAALPIPLEHLSDLEVGMHEAFEKMCTGEVNWTEYLPE